MAKTVVGVFEDKYEAEMAAEALMRNGFSDSDIDMSATDADTMSGTADYNNDSNREESSSAIGRFF